MKALFISVHPDDETLGCGGTILKHHDLGDEIFWLILTAPTATGGYTKKFIQSREKQIELVSKSYAFSKRFELKFPAANLHAIDLLELIKKIGDVIRKIGPQVIYTVNRSDIHTDHQIAAKAIMSCTKFFRNPFLKRVLIYECISETEIAPPFVDQIFTPNIYSNIENHLDRKLEIMKIYDSELRPPPFPRSLENMRALARFRGSSVGLHYAEAFMLLGEII
jgi:LmbE family N-acetylglucosaminyl deacetylase